MNIDFPPVVYHYTSVDTLLKIVENSSVWATSVRYLNDVSEIEHYVRCIKLREMEYRKTHNWERNERVPFPAAFLRLSASDDRSPEGLPFVSSFSLHRDSLPQWRSYCPQGNGVSIGLDTAVLSRFVVKDMTVDPSQIATEMGIPKFEKVQYVDMEADNPFLDEKINLAWGRAYQGGLEWAKDDPGDTEGISLQSSSNFGYEVRNDGVFVKNPSFSNEAEYRIAVSLSRSQRSAIRFRSTRSTLVPYVVLKAPDQVAASQLVREVVIGPTTNPALTRDAVECFFNARDSDVRISLSTIPFRDW